MDQRSPEWYAARLGRVTASRIADVMATTKSGPSASRKNYLAELVAERLTGCTAGGFTSPAMQWGTETEPQAVATYTLVTFREVAPAPFVPHPTIEHAGASPDGYVGEAGLIEVKCPNTATHIDTLLGGAIPDKYQKQMLFQMACTGRQWCDFVSFDPRLPEHMQIFIKRLDRDEDAVAEIEAAVRGFLAEVAETVDRLVTLYGEAA